ncbi:MAG: hypothetical protein V1737_01590, partial [Chloroflexota bacterium]
QAISKRQRRLDAIQLERKRVVRLPPITEETVKDVVGKIHGLLEVTDPQELKAALAHFIERIEVVGSDLTIFYTVAQPATSKCACNWRPRGDSNPRSPP